MLIETASDRAAKRLGAAGGARGRSPEDEHAAKLAALQQAAGG